MMPPNEDVEKHATIFARVGCVIFFPGRATDLARIGNSIAQHRSTDALAHAMDLVLLHPRLPAPDGSKISHCARNRFRDST